MTTHSSESQPAGAAGGSSVGRRVLVIDDHVDSVKSLSMLMRLWKYDVQGAHDGPCGIELAGEFRPQLILLDIGLPGMDGYEVAAQLRARPDLDGTCLVAMTGRGEEDDVRRATAAGFDHHLTKPVAAETLKEFLDSQFTGRRP
ncbi:MAG: response regulator [Planctomycetaceae bacterium]|nr:response regulator [Planctomycetaceae bacterium]